MGSTQQLLHIVRVVLQADLPFYSEAAVASMCGSFG